MAIPAFWCSNMDLHLSVVTERRDITVKTGRREQERERIATIRRETVRLALSAAVFAVANLLFGMPIRTCDAFQMPQNRRGSASGTGSQEKSGKGGRILPEVIEQVLDRVDIVDAVESFGLPKFQRISQGSSANALCPFHDDNSPSLSISRDKKIYKCFACGASGNVFNFIREYARIGGGKEIPFIQSVKIANERFTKGNPVDLGLSGQAFSGRLTQEEHMARERKRKKMNEINDAAAEFYFSCLANATIGGIARTYLRRRKFSATTAKMCGIGFAPDVYYGPKTARLSRKGKWGEGSLVFHLRGLGFSAQDIVDSGLATITKRALLQSSVKKRKELLQEKARSEKDKRQNVTRSETPGSKDDHTLDHSCLMDRFRGRLMIPIKDQRESHVLGFGGRIIDALRQNDDSNMDAPKYLNSPESITFQKKNLLFGSHVASSASSEYAALGLIVVEGYMDAITLWQAGITNVVACMGTALTKEQLSSAASISRDAFGGRIVLCLDNDLAGESAVERVCSNDLLPSIASELSVDIRVASLPLEVKDPAEFIEQKEAEGAVETTIQDFCEVIGNALCWPEWYINRILKKYDSSAVSGSAGSFGDIFDQAADFLSAIENPAERTRQACRTASSLSMIIATEEGSESPSEQARIQLEADIISKAARIADQKRANKARMEAVSGGSDTDIKNTLGLLSRGDGGADVELVPELKRKPKKSQPISPPRSRFRQRSRSTEKEAPQITEHFDGVKFDHETDRLWLGIAKSKKKRMKRDQFLGGKGKRDPIENEDAVFFNSNAFHGHAFLTKEAMDAGYKKSIPVDASDMIEKGVLSFLRTDSKVLLRRSEDSLLRLLVLFRGARTKMRRLLITKSASRSNSQIEWSSPDREWLFMALVDDLDSIPSHITDPDHQFDLKSYLSKLNNVPDGAFGVWIDHRQMAASTSENESGGAGWTNNFANVQSISRLNKNGDMLPTFVTASGPAKANGFDKPKSNGFKKEDPFAVDAIENPEILAEEGFDMKTTSFEDQSIEIAESDMPLVGSLDQFFTTDADIFTSELSDNASAKEKAVLAVQELYSALEYISASVRLDLLSTKLEASSKLLTSYENDHVNLSEPPLLAGADVEDPNMPQDSELSSQITAADQRLLQIHKLKDECSKMIIEVIESAKVVRELKNSAKITSQNLRKLDGGQGGRRQQDEEKSIAQLFDTMNSHAESLSIEYESDEIDVVDEDGNYEEDMERIKSEYGNMYHDDWKWSPGAAKDDTIEPNVFIYEEEDEDEEPLEETLQRLDKDWAWIEDEADETDPSTPEHSNDAQNTAPLVISDLEGLNKSFDPQRSNSLKEI